MKNIIKRILREEVLNEGFQDIEYHVTGIERLYNILKEDKLFLNTWLADPDDKFGDKFYYLSLSRTGYPGDAYGTYGYGFARIVFDGRKLGYNFKSMPVDYYKTQGAKPKRKKGFFEFEDRLVTDNPVIKDVSRYILRIEMLLRENDLKYGFFVRYIKLVKEMAEKRGIDLVIYGSVKDIVRGINRIDVSDIPDPDDNDEEESYWGSMENTITLHHILIPLLIYDKKYINNGGLFEEDVKKFMKQHDINFDLNFNQLGYFLSRITDGTYWMLLPKVHENLLPGISDNRDGSVSKLIGLVTKQMRKYGVMDIKGLFEAKRRENEI